MNPYLLLLFELDRLLCADADSHQARFFLFEQKLRDAGVELPDARKKGPGPQEENKTLKEEVKTLKEELDTNKKGEEEDEKSPACRQC